MKLTTPPLRERRENIPLLFEFFARDAAKTHDRIFRPLTDSLVEQSWPGNVRELRNAAERYAFDLGRSDKPHRPTETVARSLASRVEAYERDLIRQALREAKGNIADTIRLLDIPRCTLDEKMQRFRLSRDNFTG